MHVSRLFLLALLALGACVNAPTLDDTRLLDLTQSFGPSTLSWPGEPPFVYQSDAREREDGRWLATGTLSGPEQSGTYIDAPLRHAEGRRGADDLPLARLVAPIRVLDVSRACSKDRDYRATLADLRDHERLHGRVPVGAAVIVRTGWERHYDSPERYFGGLDAPRFPGLSIELARELVARKVELVGIDTASLDGGQPLDPAVHRTLAAGDVTGIENLTALGELPIVGATLIVLPLKLLGSGGGPARAIAIIP